MACAAALATLDVFEDEGLVANAARHGARLLDGLRRATASNTAVAEVRGRGLMVAIDFADPKTGAPRPDLSKALLAAALDRKLMLLTCGTYGNVVRVIPPLITTDAEIDLALGILQESLQGLA